MIVFHYVLHGYMLALVSAVSPTVDYYYYYCLFPIADYETNKYPFIWS